MNPFRRIAAQLNVSLDTFLNQIENHEASADCAIRAIRKASERARSRHHRVKLDSEKIDQRMQQLESDKGLWIDRARKCHNTDEAKALECARRVSNIEREMERLREQRKQNADIEAQLAHDLRQVEDELARLKIKRNQLASRQANAEALRTIDDMGCGSLEEVSDIFERWESRLVGVEGMPASVATSHDGFESSFLREEENEKLKAKLDEILKR